MSVSKSEEKMLKIQHQLRDNQQDLSDFLSDLNSWTESVKKKDEDLKKGKDVEETKLPPVRNSLLKKKKKKKPKNRKDISNGTEPEHSKKKKISGFDFKAWDKLDVDKICEEIDAEEEKKAQKTDSSEYETDEEWEQERKQKQAGIEKDRGNDLFKQGDYSGAIECYTRGIDMDPCNPLLPANRAMALLKQEKYGAAETDCLTALTLDPLYIKAHLRLGTARVGLKKLNDAMEVFQKVLLLEPQNKQAKMEISKIDKELLKQKMVSQADPSIDPDAGLVKPISKPEHLRSQKPLRRIQIEEIGIEDDSGKKSAMIAKVTETQSETKKTITAKDNEMFQRFTSNQNQQKAADESEIKNISNRVPQSSSETTEQFSDISTSANKDEKAGTRMNSAQGDQTESLSPRSSESSSPRSSSVPQTSFQFQADYKVLKNDLVKFYQYLKNIDPKNYPRLFGEFLDAEVLTKMLTVLRDYFIPAGENIFPHLLLLSDVKRFSMTVMFFSSREQQVTKDLFSHLRKSDKIASEDVNKLAKKYQIS